MAYANSQQQRGYVQLATGFGLIPNTSGTGTVGNNDNFLFTVLNTDAVRNTIDRPDKTGSNSAVQGQAGRRSGTGNVSFSLAGSGAAGTEPDTDFFFQSLMGKAKVVVASTSVTYGLDDNIYDLAVFNYRTPSSVTQQILKGAVVNTAKFTLGQDVALCEMDMLGQWGLDDDEFSTADATAKGGLTTFPTEPASPVSNGNFAVGFTGSVSLDGNAYGTLVNSTISVDTQTQMDDGYGSYYPVSASRGKRAVTIDASILDDDTANLSALKVKAKNGTPVDFILAAGTIAGNIWTFTLKNVILNPFTYDDSARRYAVKVTGKASATSLTSKDEFKIVNT